MAYNPPIEDVKAYRASHGGTLWDAVRALRKHHKHTCTDNTMRIANCRHGHSAVYQRKCNVCSAWYCKQCND